MENLNYRIDTFEGPLDLLLTLIQKNKVNIEDIPISLICDQYLEYIKQAELLDMELASEFIVMASDLMLIKSKMLLPKPEEITEDPRAALADALIKYKQAKEAAAKFAKIYPIFSGRMVKDTDEISVDKTFVADQDIMSLCVAVRRIIANNDDALRTHAVSFSPMISTPIVPVEVKIVGILSHIRRKSCATLHDLLADSVSRPDMIAIFLGVLELIKVRQILICDDDDRSVFDALHDVNTKFVINEDYRAEEDSDKEETATNEEE